MDVRIEWTANVYVQDSAAWKPKVIKVGADRCVKICPNDFGLVSTVAAQAGVTAPKSKRRQSLTNCPDFIELKRRRNAAQALEMDPASGKKKLFGDEVADDVKKRRRTAGDVADLRDNPQLFVVELGGDGETATATMQRPISCKDDIVVAFDEQSLATAIACIVRGGVDSAMLLSKRTYGTSGAKGVWKFGDKFYAREGHSYTKVDVSEEGVGADDAVDEHASDAHADLSELPEVE